MRIEQMPNGTYVKRVSPFEEDLINRLYQEVRERKEDTALASARLEEAETSLASAHEQINLLKTQVQELRQKAGITTTP